MPKAGARRSRYDLTRKQNEEAANESRHKKTLRYILIGVLVLAVGFAAYEVLANTLLKDARPVARVGKTAITVKQFTDRVTYERYTNVQRFVTYAASPFASLLQDQLLSTQTMLDNSVQFGGTILDLMINESALIQKAQSMGITVTEAEVDAAIQANFKYYPSGTPTATVATPTMTYNPTSTLSSLQRTLTAHTPVPVTPQSTEMFTATATAPSASETPLGSPAAAESSTPTLEPSATDIPPAKTSGITPTPTQFTSSAFQAMYSTVIADLKANASFSEQEVRDHVRTILYEQKIYDKVAAQVAPEQDMVWARHILVATQDQANEIEQKLKNGGNFSALAAQYSTDSNTSPYDGDLGWLSQGVMSKAFDDVAWSLNIGAISDPVQTDKGYEIIQLLGHEKRQLTADQMLAAQQAAYKAFTDSAKAELGVKKYDLWASVVPATPVIPAQYRISKTQSATP